MSAVQQKNVISTYRFYAPVYDYLFGKVLEDGRRKMCSLTVRLASRRILEVGVGTGLTLERYPPTAHITGIDISHEMLAKARQRQASSGTAADRIALHYMDAEWLDFPDNSFDCVTVPYVLSVTPDPARLVREVRRVCRPDGDIVIVNHFSGNGAWRFLEWLSSGLADRIGFRSTFDYAEHIEAHDWQVQSVEPANLLNLSKVIHIRNAKPA